MTKENILLWALVLALAGFSTITADSCQSENNTELVGGTIQNSVSNQTNAACCALCMNMYECNGYNWNSSDSGTCWFLLIIGTASPRVGTSYGILVNTSASSGVPSTTTTTAKAVKLSMKAQWLQANVSSTVYQSAYNYTYGWSLIRFPQADPNQTAEKYLGKILAVLPTAKLMTPFEFVQYYLQYDSLNAYKKETTEKIYEDFFELPSLIFGLVGSILSLVVFRGKDFVAISFLYHKVANGLEILEKLSEMTDNIKDKIYREMPNLQQVYFLEWFDANLDDRIKEAVFGFVNILTLGMGIERVIALWFPLYFRTVNNYKFFGLIIFFGVLYAAIYVPMVMRYDLVLSGVEYAKVTTNMGASAFDILDKLTKTYIDSIVIVLIWITTTLIIIKLILNSKDRKKLFKDQSEEMEKQMKRDKRICIFMLVLAVPLIVQFIFNIADVSLKSAGPWGPDAYGLSYTEAMKYWENFRVYITLHYIFGAAYRFSHDSTFYLYLLFNQRFRQGFLAMFCPKLAAKFLLTQPTAVGLGSIATKRKNRWSQVQTIPVNAVGPEQAE